MRQFYSCIDALLPAPQPEQHELSRKKAAKEGGQIVFYGAEEYRVAKHQPFILGKLLRTGGIDGVVFFSIDQFCYGEFFNLKLLGDILRARFSVHFAREDISFNSVAELTEKFIVLSAYFNAFRRRRTIRPEEILRGAGCKAG
jgi:hypothetical protein